MRKLLSVLIVLLVLCPLAACEEKALDSEAAQELPKFVIPAIGLESWDKGEDFVKLTLTPDAALQFSDYVRVHMDKEIALYLDGTFIMAPHIQNMPNGPEIILRGLDADGVQKISASLPPEKNMAY